MYSVRGLDLVTVAVNPPEMRAAVQQLLEKQHASSRNLMFASGDTAALERAFDADWGRSTSAGLPYTVLLTPDGKIAYRKAGVVDMLELRRTILANFDWEYEGFAKYWGQKPE